MSTTTRRSKITVLTRDGLECVTTIPEMCLGDPMIGHIGSDGRSYRTYRFLHVRARDGRHVYREVIMFVSPFVKFTPR